MDPQTQQYLLIGAIVVVALLLLFLIVRTVSKRRERKQLHDQFGPEYERTIAARGSKRAAVRDLKERQTLRRNLELRDLNEADRGLVREHMASLQYRFVEDPSDVLLSTGRVITEVLRARGYPIAEDREKALRLVSVDYPAEAIAIRSAITGDFHGDVDKMRRTFVGVREALTKMAGITYVVGDARENPDDLHVENHVDPHATHTESETTV